MKLEQQVVSLELSTRLYELGVRKESYFKWVQEDGVLIIQNETDLDLYKSSWGMEHKLSYPAYTVAELGEMLPKRLKNHWKISSMYKFKRGTYVDLKIAYHERTKEQIVSYYGDTGFENSKDIYFHGEIAKTEADARAKMLIYLLENKLITLN